MAKEDRNRHRSGLEVAVIGMAGRFPGAGSVEALWRNLRAGIESITVFTTEELVSAGVDPALCQDPRYVPAKGYLEDADLFDADFFGIGAREAELLDPQQRLFLECAWEALESGAYDPGGYPGWIGVYAGSTMSSYYLANLRSRPDLLEAAGHMQIGLGNDKDYLTTRTSYKLNLEGPSLNIQTACSTSLVAVHLACQALLRGECDLALAGGVSVGVPLISGYLHQEGGILSPDGHTRSFDAAARGCVGGNGVAVVLLKKLDEALADGDVIHAVIRGSALNNDGASKIGYTAPRIDGQAKVVRAAHIMADVAPDSITYVEAHGTATELGDPAEVAALTQAFGHGTDRRGFCAIGSVKSNLGHLDAAAGVTGLIKTVLALEHGEIPPSLHFEQPNPQIDFAATPFFVNTELRPWPAGDGPRRAGVSSFGIGGTNAHVVLEEAPPRPPPGASRPWQLLTLSARTSRALERVESNLAAHLAAHGELSLADVAWSLHIGRKTFAHRRILVRRDLEEARAGLERRVEDEVAVCDPGAAPSQIAFLLPGQGAQRVGMVADLYRIEASFREDLDRCAELLRPHLGLDFRAILYPSAGGEGKAAEQLRQTAVAQPVLFAVEHALARLWERWGIRPGVLLGHSLGELVAACLAGVLSLEDALRVVSRRGALMQDLPAGAMLSVPLGEDDIAGRLEGELELAAVNGPVSVVVSGSVEAVRELRDHLAAKGIAARLLETSHAFHSAVMEPIRGRFAEEMAEIELHPPRIPYLSNLTGTWIEPEQATDPAYWGEHLRRTVRFDAGLTQLLAHREQILLEVGPWGGLATLARRHPGRGVRTAVVSTSPPPRETTPGDAYLLGALGRLWLAGAQPDWQGFHAGEQRHRVTLPTYPFERRRYWVEAAPQGERARTESRQKIEAERRIDPSDWFYIPGWKRALPMVAKGSRQEGAWLFFLDDLGLGRALADEIASRGETVATVIAGPGFVRLAGADYRIHPGRREDYAALLGELCRAGRGPTRIVHLWAVDGGGLDLGEAVPEPVLRQRGFTSLIFLAQAIGEQMLAGGFGGAVGETALTLIAVSDHLHEVTGEEIPCPGKATLLGPVQVIPQEYPNFRCYNLDLLLPERESPAWERLVVRLSADLASPGSEPLVCYRGTERWIPVFDPLRLERPETLRALRPGGCYLITGGLGGIGLELARGLARTAGANLVLTGRSSVPPRAEWKSRIAAGDPLAAKLTALLEIEELGGTLLILQADVTDGEAMEKALAAAAARFGPLHGVFHAAGLAGGTLIQRQSPEIAAAVLAPKVEGTQVLDRLLAEVELDFFIVFSSQRAFLGGAGQADYCAANRFLEALARARSRCGRPSLAIAWDGWREVGMGYERAVRAGREEEDLADGLSNDQGWDVLRRLLAVNGFPQVVVSTRDFPSRLEELRQSRAGAVLVAAMTDPPRADAHPRPRLATPFVPPRDRTEEMLAGIWSRLLGVAPIGIDDNFFELGGDSVVSLQIVSIANQEGLRLTPRQVFQYPTIAGLAAVVGSSAAIRAQQGPVSGEVPLTPIQHGFFERKLADPHYHNQSVLVRCGERLDAGLLERVVARLHEHHDALRLRFESTTSGWRQICSLPGGSSVFHQIDLSALPPGALAAAVTAVASRMQAAFDLARGPLSRVALLELGEGHAQRLLWIIHHLAVDVVSWRILLGDLETLYRAAEQDGSVDEALPAKTTSYQEWAERLREHARKGEVLREAEHWLAQPWHRVRPLPVDRPESENRWSSAQVETFVLDPETTHALVHEAPGAARAQVRDLLLTALARAFQAWTGESCLLVDLEGHGREAIFEDVDLTRTVGWFTNIYPVLLDLEARSSLGEALNVVKEQLRGVPSHGLSYGLVRAMGPSAVAERLAQLPPAEVILLYTGQVDETASPSLYTPAPESPGANQSPCARRSHLLDLTLSIEGKRLHARWTWSRDLWAPGVIPALARSYEQAVRELVRHCLAGQGSTFIPADFPLAELEAAEIEELAARFGEIEDVYPLSPVQEGLLFHTLYEPGSGVYVTDFHWTFRGELDPEPLRRAWQHVVDRHTALRTAFAWERLRRPMQVVLRNLDLPWAEHDWRAGDPEESLRALLRGERARGFDVGHPPLMRLHLGRSGEDLYTLIWTFHHLLIDGWAVAGIFAEVLAAWAAFARGDAPSLGEVRPYRDYIAWLRQQDLSRAEAVWRRTLTGFNRPVPLPGAREKSPGGTASEPVRIRRSRTLSEEVSSALLAFGRAHQLTFNSLVQGAWALLLASYAGNRRDVVFGAVSSGRPDSLPGVESMVGLFINTLPLRVRVEPELPLVPWLRQIQQQHVEMREFEYTPLVEVHGWSQVPRGQPLFETLLVFDNIPASGEGNAPDATDLGLELVEAGGTDQNSYPLTVTVYPRREIDVEMTTDSRWYDEATVEAMLEELLGLLGRMAARPGDHLDDLLGALTEDRRRTRLRAAARRHADNLNRLKNLRPVAVNVQESEDRG